MVHILARKHKFGKASNLILDHMISQLSPELRYSQCITVIVKSEIANEYLSYLQIL